ncbi:MAG: hypothetical protein ABS87_14330 [Sphingomonas sp. SCN 67-18]|nr:GAF domain-containing protein [Sphingomonas sp. SCN 67-18]ODU18891.1 MAG: hypothetical protein ABS87_14330 [Sphingomonas sp. SCN 67-18]
MNDSAGGLSLAAAVRAIGQARSVGEIVAAWRRTARQVIGADGITLVRRERDQVRYIAEDAVGPLWLDKCFPLPACISGIAMLEERPIIIPDITADPRVPYNAYMGTFVRSMIMVPVGRHRPRAAIGPYWQAVDAPSDRALAVLETIADTVADTLARVETPADNLQTHVAAA